METEGYRRVVLAHKDRVFSYAAYLLGDSEEARDVAQESLLRLWQHHRSIEEVGAARAWLLRTAHRLCLDRIRVRSSRSVGGPDSLLDLPGEANAEPEHAASSRELSQALLRALESLGARDRAVLLMREVEGMSYQELAMALEVPLGTLKAVLHRARERLRQRLLEAGVRP